MVYNASKFDGATVTVPGSLRVFRAWDSIVSAQNGRSALVLSGLFFGNWEHNTMQATCKGRSSHSGYSTFATMLDIDVSDLAVPVPECMCGIYGYYKPGNSFVKGASIRGSIRVSGKVLLGTTGVRAQHAEIESICVTYPARLKIANDSYRSMRETKNAIKERFVDVPLFFNKLAWRLQFPPESVKELIDG